MNPYLSLLKTRSPLKINSFSGLFCQEFLCNFAFLKHFNTIACLKVTPSYGPSNYPFWPKGDVRVETFVWLYCGCS